MSAADEWFLLDRKVSEEDDSIVLVSLWTYRDARHKARITRERSTRKDQSFARIERWSGTRWEELYTYSHDIMAQVIEDSIDLQHNRPNRAELLDEQELLRLANLILL